MSESGPGIWRNKQVLIGAAAGWLFMAGCSSSHPSNEQLQQQAAQATQQAKQTAQQAADKARVAAATAEDKINAVAAGVKQGLQTGPAQTAVDLNSATSVQLQTLPGITPGRAQRIIAARPYSDPADLVSKNVLTQQQLDRISGKVTARPPAS